MDLLTNIIGEVEKWRMAKKIKTCGGREGGATGSTVEGSSNSPDDSHSDAVGNDLDVIDFDGDGDELKV